MRKADLDRTGASWADCKWILDLETLGEDGAWRHHKSEEFDLVIMCLGNYSEKPHLPSFSEGKGPEVFCGESIHSASFKSAQNLQGRHVGVIGFGKTALDIAVAVAAAQEESGLPVTLIFRKAKWIIPRKALERRGNNSRPYLRFTELWVAKPERHWAEHLLHTLGFPLVWLYWAVQQRVIRGMLDGLVQSGSYRPRHSLQSALGCPLALEPEGFQELVKAGRIVLKEVSDWHYTERGLRLNGHDDLALDTVLLCTGYDGPSKLAEILPENERQFLAEHQDGLHLFRGIIHPKVPAVAFLGYNMTFSVVHSSELGAKWLAKLAGGSFDLPSEEEMERDREKWRTFREKNWISYPERGQCFAPLNLTYYDMLRADMGWPKLVLSSNPLKNLIAPIASREVCEP
ncbi:putative dimethylaniline monooxygenase [Klebsormidium nitens]|uniref:Flavin-containing monooxygenase n=1 Tax=Klebsormidium nitens TaxID=105231 RepID=A0A1Y1IC81_KLENI|nr:putative dimethylaniline monooxygenase [Klebsormidium nitens]|eukprot:GAQ86347.1 putative dimethylaniline monooxygenase [Klebsormidium nitens]